MNAPAPPAPAPAAVRDRALAITAAVATAAAIVCAAAALSVPVALVALALVPAVVMVASQPNRRVPREGHHTADLLKVTIAAGVVVIGLHPQPANYPTVARFVLAGAIALSWLWPAPVVVRYCLLLAAGCLAAAGGPLTDHAVAAALLAASAATALVALNRLGTPTAVRGRRVAGEAAILLLIAGLIGLLVATLIPPPDGGGTGDDPGGGRRSGNRTGPFEPQPQFLLPLQELDAGGTGTGKGDEVMFRVSAPESALWRTMTFDSYDGRSWTRAEDLTDPPNGLDLGSTVVPPGIGDATGTATGTALEQHVTIETAFAAALPAALRPESIRAPFVTPLPDATVRGIARRGQSYDVTSRVPPGDADALRPHDARQSGVPFDVRGLYLPFPGLPARATTLATDITAGATTSYDQVEAVVAWMRANTVVRSGARALPPDADPVDQYLFVDRAGSSQQAATATALLLRMLGVPARLAAGYLPGDLDPFTGDFVVRARHAHVWVEAWFPDVGWVGFDPSGRFLGPEPAGDSLLDRLKRLWWVLVIVVLVALAVLAGYLLARRRRLRARPWATQTYERLTRAGSRHGRPRQPHETPAEYCGALAGGVDERLVQVGELVSTAAWSRHEPNAEARAWADEVVAATERSAPRRRPLGRRRSAESRGQIKPAG